MALRISNASGTFDLSKDFSTEIEDSSPIYNERGSQSKSKREREHGDMVVHKVLQQQYRAQKTTFV